MDSAVADLAFILGRYGYSLVWCRVCVSDGRNGFVQRSDARFKYQGCSYHEEKRIKLSSAALAFILFTIPCLAQQNAATIELGRASIRIGMPQDKAISALAAEGFILKKMGTQYIVGRIGRTGQTSREGRVSFVPKILVDV